MTFWDMLKLGWATIPQDRPGIEDVLKRLEKAASSWTPPSLSMAVPLTVNSPTWNTSDITDEQNVGVDEREVSSLSQPSVNPPPMDGAGNNSIHPPAHGVLALLQETPGHQDLGADVMVPDRFTSSTPPPVYTDDRLRSLLKRLHNSQTEQPRETTTAQVLPRGTKGTSGKQATKSQYFRD
jgi:hypothetical protein